MTDKAREISLGREAQTIIGSSVYQEVMRQMRERVVASWRAAPIRDTEGQMYLKLMAKVIDDFDATLTSFAQGGRLAEDLLARHEKHRKANPAGEPATR